VARISFPERGLGEHVDWALLRTDMAVGTGPFSEAVYGNSICSACSSGWPDPRCDRRARAHERLLV
jgi:hypothetical protein